MALIRSIPALIWNVLVAVRLIVRFEPVKLKLLPPTVSVTAGAVAPVRFSVLAAGASML